MRTTLRLAVLCALMGTSLTLSTAAFAAGPGGAINPSVKTPTFSGPASLADEVEVLLPAVVNISSTQRVQVIEDMPDMPHFPPGSPFEDFFEEFMGQQQGENGAPMAPPASLGSGFIVDAEKGYVVTNAHVIQDADEVRVTLHDDTTMPAEVLGKDEKTDLALLKVTTTKKLTAVKFGDSGQMRVGDWIIAIGNPFGLGGTVTTGIISARARDIQSGPYDDYIQTDASINRGNSGGPMFNLNGEVIGINTAIYSPTGGSIGIGFAIPSNLARPVIDQLAKYGKTRRGWMGVRIQEVTEDIAESLGLDKTGGALVASLTPTGPAEKAGLKQGDIILKFDGKDVTAMRGLPRIVAETEIGKDVEVEFWREGKMNKTTVMVGELEKAEETGLLSDDPSVETPEKKGSGVTVDSVGLTFSAISSEHRTEFNIPNDVTGVIISAVKRGSEAAEKGFMVGDVVIEINQQPVSDARDAATLIQAAIDSKRKKILLLISREGNTRFEALDLERKPVTSEKKKDRVEKTPKQDAPIEETTDAEKDDTTVE